VSETSIKSISLTVLLALSSGLLGAVFTDYRQQTFDMKKEKMATIKKLFGHRFVLYESTCAPPAAKIIFNAAISESYLIFNDSEEVRKHLEDLIDNPDAQNPAWIELYESMMKDIGIKYTNRVVLDRPIRKGC